MIADQLPFDIDDNYPDLVRSTTQEPPLSSSMKKHCPRCTGRLHLDGGIANCIQCGYEDYDAPHRPNLAGLTTGSSLPTTYKPKSPYGAPTGGYHRRDDKKAAGW